MIHENVANLILTWPLETTWCSLAIRYQDNDDNDRLTMGPKMLPSATEFFTFLGLHFWNDESDENDEIIFYLFLVMWWDAKKLFYYYIYIISHEI